MTKGWRQPDRRILREIWEENLKVSRIPAFQYLNRWRVLCSPEDRSLPTRRSYRPTKIQLSRVERAKTAHIQNLTTMAEHMHCFDYFSYQARSEILFILGWWKDSPLTDFEVCSPSWGPFSTGLHEGITEHCIIRNFSGNILQILSSEKDWAHSIAIIYVCVIHTRKHTYIYRKCMISCHFCFFPVSENLLMLFEMKCCYFKVSSSVCITQKHYADLLSHSFNQLPSSIWERVCAFITLDSMKINIYHTSIERKFLYFSLKWRTLAYMLGCYFWLFSRGLKKFPEIVYCRQSVCPKFLISEGPQIIWG